MDSIEPSETDKQRQHELDTITLKSQARLRMAVVAARKERYDAVCVTLCLVVAMICVTLIIIH